MSIAEDKLVDIHNLHIEDQKQPALVEKWGRRFADAKKKKRELERKVEVTFSNLVNVIRQDPEEFGLDKKPTETSIKNIVLVDKEYSKVYDEYLGAKYEQDIMEVGRDTISDRRATIDGEIKLYLSGYYSQTTRSGEEFQQDELKRNKDKQKRLRRRDK